MSLTRKMLKAMGIEEDAIEQIIEAHTETTDSLKAERDGYREEAGKVNGLEQRLEAANKALEEAASDNGYDELKKRYDTEHAEYEKLVKKNEQLAEKAKEFDGIKAEYEEYKQGVESKETHRAKRSAYKKLLKDAGISQKYMGPVLRVADVDTIELEEDGTVKDAEAIIEKVKTDWPEFIAKVETHGADPETPPEPTGGIKGANPRAVQIAKERHERLYGKSEE